MLDRSRGLKPANRTFRKLYMYQTPGLTVLFLGEPSMTIPTIQRVNALYEVAAKGRIGHLEVSCESLHAFSKSLKHFTAILGDAAKEEIWKMPSRILKHLFYGLLFAPVPFNQDGLIEDAELHTIATNGRLYKSISLSGWQALEGAVTLAIELRTKAINPLFSALVGAYPRGTGHGVLLLRDSRFVPDVEKLLRRHPATSKLRVVTAGQLKGNICEKRLVIVGPSSWHPDYVIEARRASDVEILKYDWLRDKPRETRFQGGWGGGVGTQQSPETYLSQASDEHLQNLLDLVVPMDWSHIHAVGASGHSTNDIDSVSARLVVLEGGFAVFLENDPSATVLLIDLEAEDKRHKVVRSS